MRYIYRSLGIIVAVVVIVVVVVVVVVAAAVVVSVSAQHCLLPLLLHINSAVPSVSGINN